MKRVIVISLLLLLALLPAASARQGITPCAAFTISVSNTSANQQLSTCGDTVLLWNVGSQEAFYTFGSASNTAATTSNYSIPATSFAVLSLGLNGLYLAAITSTSTTTLRVTQGNTN